MNFLNQLRLKVKTAIDSVVTRKAVADAQSQANDAVKTAEQAVKEVEKAKMNANIEALKAKLPSPVKDMAEASAKFGPIVQDSSGKYSWPNETQFCASVKIPESISAKWINSATGKPTTQIYCNKLIHVPLVLALLNVEDRGLLSELKFFDGCYMIRVKRGLEDLSVHSYALAIDINAKENPLGADSKFSPEFVKCFTDAGWVWGGNWHRKDAQHFQYLVNG